MHPLEASRALKRISAHIQMADGARVPGVRMVADGAWVRVDIAIINSNVARFVRSMFIETKRFTH